MIKYRPDIDGLRAVAVVPVVLFHSGFTLFSGGYVGVDVFFVISGYLITKIILDDMEQRRYSVVAFYERRIRRIIPAYLAMVIATMAVAFFLMLPEDLEEMGASALWSALMSSNVFFWLESRDYFAGAAELKPLLHTWSLSVEEQFYAIFPLVLVLVQRIDLWRYAAIICGVGAVASFGLSVYGVAFAPMAAFYLLPTRAWELMAGSILAFAVVPAAGRRLAAWETYLGLLLILVPVFAYIPDTPFPGLMALPPVLGATLIIHSGIGSGSDVKARSFVSRILSSSPFRLTGLISYSLYLWHWPIVVFTKYYYIEISAFQKVLIVAASFIVAFLSWKFLEQPGRYGFKSWARPRLFFATAASIALIGSIGWSALESGGFPSRVPEPIQRLALKSAHQGPWRDCGMVFRDRRSLDTICVRGAADRTPDFLIVGDSHANALAAAIFQAGAEVGRAGYQISDNAYRPLLAYRKFGEERKYDYLNKLTKELLDTTPEIKDVIVVVYWRQAALVDGYYDASGKYTDGVTAARDGFSSLVSQYSDRRFLFVLSTANSDLFGANPAARAAWFGRAFDPVVDVAEFKQMSAGYKSAIELLRRQPNVRLLDLSARVCDAKVCHGFLKDKLAFTDDNHLSYAATRLFNSDLTEFLGNAQQAVNR